MTAATDNHSSPGMVEIAVDDLSKVDPALDDAIATIRPAATRHRTGIMITRTAPGRYIVRAHPAVPYGLIRQHPE